MKMAVVHDYLCGMGGSERVFQYICEEFPEADIYTLAYNPNLAPQYFRKRLIRTTWINRFVQSMNAFRWSFPISTYVMNSIDLSAYDVVLSSSATVAKYIKVPNGKHICYCYIPTRALWQTNEYFGNSYKATLIKFFLNYLKKRDYAAAQSVDRFIAISKVTQDQIKKIYNKNSEIIPSPINAKEFLPVANKSDNYLIVSRLEQWKCVDYAIEAFNKLKLPLRIIGSGIEEQKLKQIANANITFLGAVDDDTLSIEYAKAKAVIFTPFLEYGLIPLEANASGTPVICYGKGGVTETMISVDNYCKNTQTPTAVFFYKQTPEALISALKQFDLFDFDKEALVRHALKWDVPAFKRNIRKEINNMHEI
jgi:glycosyltransferase involved in cell wall biosynthesis